MDGALLFDAELGKPLERNPGRYSVVVDLFGGPELSRIVDLKEGANEQVTIDLPAPVVSKPPEVKPAPLAAPLARAELRSTPVKRPAEVQKGVEPPRRGSLAPSFAAFGVGAVGVGLGAWAGAATLINVGILKDNCDGNSCEQAAASMLARTKTFSVVSTIAFAVGGAGVATGVTLLVLRSRRKTPASVEVHAGPATISVTGVF